MLLTGAGCAFLGFILHISGVNGRENSICALKDSSVDLPCSAQHPTSGRKWYTVRKDDDDYVTNELPADGCVTYMSEGLPTLTIDGLSKHDENFYCCSEDTERAELCWERAVQLNVSDLQVRVFPATEGQTVTLMCSTSCPLTEKPAAYIWYKNRELLYEDWSPWYQELVSSDKAVRYSCAIKGYEGVGAPEVSVDSVSPTCFTVTYAEGRMCDQQTSVEEPCSITYPTEVQVLRTSDSPTALTCSPSCPITVQKIAFGWYKNGGLFRNFESQQFSVKHSAESFSCAVQGLEHLWSPEVCAQDKTCSRVNYVSRRICALEGLSVNITSEYSHPRNLRPTAKSWYTIKRGGEQEGAKKLVEAADHVEHHDNMKNQHILTIKHLKKTDSAEYMFRLQRPNGGWKPSDVPGVTLVVTGLSVRLHPAVVTEGQTVTLTCSTSCPLSGNTTYIWYLDGRPLTLPQSHKKHLVLDPVSSQHAGKYSCGVRADKRNITSIEKNLTVISMTGTAAAAAAAAGIGAALLVFTTLVVFFCTRRKRTSGRPPTTEATDNAEQLNPGAVYENISAQPTQQDDPHYSRVHFSKNQPAPLYATIQPRQPKAEEHVAYAVVNFRPNMSPE